MTEPIVVHLGPGESIAQALIRAQLIATGSKSITIPPGVHIVNPDVTRTRITDPPSPRSPMTDLHDLIRRMADELDHYRQLLCDDRTERHALATEARAALAAGDGPAVPEGREPASVAGEATADDLVVGELVSRLRTKAATEKRNACHYSAILLTRAADLLTRLALQPVPVSERPWEREGWCDANQQCWMGHPGGGEFIPSWRLCRPEDAPRMSVTLPAHAIPLPREVQP